MSVDEFKIFMAELSEIMSDNASQPPDEPMYVAMRAWLKKTLVQKSTTEGGIS